MVAALVLGLPAFIVLTGSVVVSARLLRRGDAGKGIGTYRAIVLCVAPVLSVAGPAAAVAFAGLPRATDLGFFAVAFGPGLLAGVAAAVLASHLRVLER